MIQSFVSTQFLRFLLTGGIAALVNFFSRIFYDQWLGFSASILLAYVTGMITAFVLARVFVFQGSIHSLQRSALAFSVVNLVAIAQTWAISIGLAYYVLPAFGVEAWVDEIAHAAGVMFPVFTSFIGHKYWSFR